MGKLRGKKILLLTAHGFEDIEVLYPVLRLSEEGAEVTVATLRRDAPGHFSPRPYHPDKPITGRFGSTIPFVVMEEGKRWQHREIDAVKAKDFDALVLPGGFGPDALRIDSDTLKVVADMHRAGKWVAAICHGPQILISADLKEGTDIVKGREVTSYAAVRDDLVNAGGKYVDVPAVISGNVITSRVPDDLPDFCLAIIRALAGEAADGVQRAA